MKIEVNEIQTINLEKNDTLVITLGSDVKLNAIRNFTNALKKQFPNNKTMVLCGDNIKLTKCKCIDRVGDAKPY